MATVYQWGAVLAMWLDRIATVDKFVQRLTLDLSMRSNPKDKVAIFVIRQLAQSVDSDTAIGSGFFKSEQRLIFDGHCWLLFSF